MAIFRCNSCGHLREVTNDYIGASVKCPECRKANPVHETVSFVEKVIRKYLVQRTELREIKQQLEPEKGDAFSASENNSLKDMDLFNTSALTSQIQYKPIVAWFKTRHIEVDVDEHTVDTRGFFDEVAVQIGDNHEILKAVVGQIKYNQSKGYSSARIDLSNKSKKEIEVITEFGKTLYEYSFVARCYRDKKENIIRLTLQTSKTIVRFFDGIWAEWFVFMKLLSALQDNNLPVACLRSLVVKHSNDAANEIDIFFLVGDIPVCIECKSGEYRNDIQKYSSLRKRLKLDKENFLMFVLDPDEDQLQGLNSMYDLTFVNQDSLIKHVETLIAFATD